jgi:outer membrane protein assembly factor BamB
MKTQHWFLLALSSCALTVQANAADWPQWRGPDRTDVSKETGLLKSWPQGGPPLLWTFDAAGVGYSGPAIVGERLYCMGGMGSKDYLYALDLRTNPPKRIWATDMGPLSKKDHGDGPRATPTVDGDCVYGLSGEGDLVCVQSATGKRLWHRNLLRDLGGQMMSHWGYSESPLVDGNKVICTPGGKQGALAALDKKTGKVLWRSKRFTDAAGYSSVVVSTACGIRQYVQMTGQSVAGVAAADGRLLWRYAHQSRTAAIPTPIVHDDFIYVTSAYQAGCALIQLTPDGKGGIRAEEVYANRNMENQHGGVLLVGDYIYGAWGGNGPRRIQKWICQELKTGKVVWEEGDKLEKGAITYADGELYCFGEDSGTVVLIEASPEGWKEKGRFTIPRQTQVPRRGKIWTHPVVANGHLYLRDQDLIFCFNVKDGAVSKR